MPAHKGNTLSRMSQEEYDTRLHRKCKETGHKIVRLGPYTGMGTKTKHKCLKCDYLWSPLPANLLNVGSGCKGCRPKRKLEPLSTLKARVEKKHDTIKVLGRLKANKNTRLRLKCLVCKHKWNARTQNVLRYAGCPECAFFKVYKKWKKVRVQGKTFRCQGYEPFAIDYLAKIIGIPVKDINTEIDNRKTFPRIDYLDSDGKKRIYHPDLFIPKRNILVEVKSDYTLIGADPHVFESNKRKVKASRDKGYRLNVLVFNKAGKRIKLPNNWLEFDYEQMHDFLKSA